MKRFRVKTGSETIKFKSSKLIKCVDWIKTHESLSEEFFIEDVKDDIEIDAYEVLQAFDEGELYTDLQGF